MKSDQDLLRAWSERNGKPRLLTEATVLQLMAKARQEVINDVKEKIPKKDMLEGDFKAFHKRVIEDPEIRAAYNQLTQEQVYWAWFSQGASAAIKKFKDQ
jgi:hypothetical protein